MSNVTRLLDAAAAGDRRVAADLLPLVQDELHTFAAVRLAAEAPGLRPWENNSESARPFSPQLGH